VRYMKGFLLTVYYELAVNTARGKATRPAPRAACPHGRLGVLPVLRRRHRGAVLG
jgi:hypothetical protein